MGAMSMWAQRLLIANIVIFFLAQPGTTFFQAFWYYPPYVGARPWTLVTYMFLHGSAGHLFFNMIGLYFFGPRLEDRLGGKTFLWLYFLSGLAGAVLQTMFARSAPMVGASGAIYGLLAGYALYWPREKILVFFVLPMEVWLAVTLFVAYSLYAGMGNMAGGIAHFAHLGGAGAGFAFLKWWDWKKGASKREFQAKMHADASPTGFMGDRMAMARWKGISIDGLHELNREEVERLLEKAAESGAGSLTASERQFLDRMAGGTG